MEVMEGVWLSGHQMEGVWLAECGGRENEMVLKLCPYQYLLC